MEVLTVPRSVLKRVSKLSCMCGVQVGTLQPNADESLRATLIIQHPHEPINYEQGSFLSPEDVQSLASMDQHQELLHIKAIIQQRLAQVCMHADTFKQPIST